MVRESVIERLEPFAQVRLLPPAIGVVLAATAIPVELRHPSIDFLSVQIEVGDVLRNVALFLPLGAALRHRQLSFVFSVSLAISMAIECLQFAYPHRHPSPIDVFSNVLGAALGWGAARRLLGRSYGWQRVRGIIVGTAMAVLVLLLVVMSRPGGAVDFSTWSSDYRLAVGDELTHDRTLSGSVQGFVLFGSSLDREDLLRLYLPDGGDSEQFHSMVGERPIHALTPPASARVLPGASLLDPRDHGRLFESLVASESLTVAVWYQADHVRHDDCARIVTYSKNHHNRNFTLGQEEGALIFRLRTPATGPNGNAPETKTPRVLTPGRPLYVAATFDGKVSRIYLNSRLVGRKNLAATRSVGSTLFDCDAPLVAVLAGLLMTTVLVGSWPPRSRATIWVVAAVGGSLGAGSVIAVGGLAALPEFSVWSMLLGLGGGACVALAIDVGFGRNP